MKKNISIIFLLAILINCYSQKAPISINKISTPTTGKELIEKHDPVLSKHAKETFKQKQKASKSSNSRWYNYAFAVDEVLGNDIFTGNILFPDTTILQQFSNGVGPTWVNSIGTVLDPTSSWFNDYAGLDDLILSKSDGYSVDSISMMFQYNRKIHNVTDTLIFEFRIFNNGASNADAPLYFFTDPKQLPAITTWGVDTAYVRYYKYDETTPDHDVKHSILKYKYLLTAEDTLATYRGIQSATFGLPSKICLEANTSLLCNVKFKPGYTWKANIDTITKKNSLRFYSYKERGIDNLLSYIKHDYNSSFIYSSSNKFDPNAGFYLNATPSMIYSKSYYYDNHWISFKISGLKDLDITSSNDDTICSGDNKNLFTSGGSTYKWNTGETTETISVSPLATSTYLVTVNEGCVYDTDKIIITVNINSIDLGNDIVSCKTVHEIDASPFYESYKWSTTSISQKINVSGNGAYCVTVTDINGCEASDCIDIEFHTPPTAIISTKDADCGSSNGSAWVDVSGGTGGYTYIWNIGLINDSIYGLSGGILYVTVSDSNCNIPLNKTINETGGPTIEISPASSSICEGESVIISAKGADDFIWKPTSYVSTNDDTSYVLSPLVTTTYSLKGTNSSNCASYKEVIITIKESPKPNLGNDIIISEDVLPLKISITPGSKFISYKWHDNSLSSTFTKTIEDIYTTTTDLKFSCEVKALNGCKASDEILYKIAVGINELPDNTSINIFPNPNNGNFSIETIGVKGTLNIDIYSITGELVDKKKINTNNERHISNYNISNIKNGIYFVKITGEDIFVTKKLIIH